MDNKSTTSEAVAKINKKYPKARVTVRNRLGYGQYYVVEGVDGSHAGTFDDLKDAEASAASIGAKKGSKAAKNAPKNSDKPLLNWQQKR